MRLQQLGRRASASLGWIGRNAILTAGLIGAAALLLFAVMYFRYVPIPNPGGTPMVWDRLKQQSCFAPAPPPASGPKLLCTTSQVDAYDQSR
jgi:hypothetical protein